MYNNSNGLVWFFHSLFRAIDKAIQDNEYSTTFYFTQCQIFSHILIVTDNTIILTLNNVYEN